MAEMTQIAPAIGGVGSILGFIGNQNAATQATSTGGRQAAAATAAAKRAADAAIVTGERKKAADTFQAAQLDQNAGQAIAASQRVAMDERRRTALLVSRGVAVAAASGGSVTDPTVSKLLADIAGEGSYRASVDLYQGEDRARAMRLAAQTKLYEGDIATAEGSERADMLLAEGRDKALFYTEGGNDRASAYNTASFGNVMQGASLYSKYGMGGPKNYQQSDWAAGDAIDWG